MSFALGVRFFPCIKINTEYNITRGQRDPQSLGVTGDELHDGPERGPVDRDGARSTKSDNILCTILVTRRGRLLQPNKPAWAHS